MALEDFTKEQLAEAREGMIPKDRFDEATNKLKSSNQELSNKLANLEGQVNTLQSHPQQPAAQTPKEYTRAQLKEYVDGGQYTQEQVDEVWDQQVARKHKQDMDALEVRMDARVGEGNATQNIAAEIDRYAEHLPGIYEEGHEDREKVGTEYNRLTARLGMPTKGSKKDLELQVLALENAFGPSKKLGKRRSNGKHDTMEQSSGNGQSSGPPQTGALKDLNADQKSFYEKGISRGLYKDWDAVRAELEFDPKK